MEGIRSKPSTPWESEEDLANIETKYSEETSLLIYAVEKESFRISDKITIFILLKLQITLIYKHLQLWVV